MLDSAHQESSALFSDIAEDISNKGFSIQPAAVPAGLAHRLRQHVKVMDDQRFGAAGIGRDLTNNHNEAIRCDQICWIDGESEVGREWLQWAAIMQRQLNRELYLGLFSFESHFAHYRVGDFYKRHLDAFKGQANRVLSLVVYLNESWQPQDGGELVLYADERDMTGTVVIPNFGTLVVFLSEQFPHEVRVAHHDRCSIAGWFRINSSDTGRVDPPS